MKQTLLAALMIGLIAFIGQAQDYKTLIGQADSLRKAKEYRHSLQAYEQAFKLEQQNYIHIYNAACSAALAGKKKKAFALLDQSVQQGG